MSVVKDAQDVATRAAMKEERARDAARAMREYEEEKRAVQARTERLRALRLAREAGIAVEAVNGESKKPAKKPAKGNAKHGSQPRK